MNTYSEYRNATRRELPTRVDVLDCMTGQLAGHIVDISASGLQLASPLPMTNDALYQWRFTLPFGEVVECGVHVLWVSATRPGEYAAGARFILIPRVQQERIRIWCESAHDTGH